MSAAGWQICAGLPHARGGVSFKAISKRLEARSSPRPWGCFLMHDLVLSAGPVFPTPVGVFPKKPAYSGRLRGSSPRPWGCFPVCRRLSKHRLVFPTPVGVFLKVCFTVCAKHCLPHARGGVSQRGVRSVLGQLSSPRPWGCFDSIEDLIHSFEVFPTPVGVFPE